MLVESLGIFVLQNIFNDFVSTLTNNAKTTVNKWKLREAFINCGDVLAKFENKGEDSFGEVIQQVFSKENLQTIYKMMKDELGYDIHSFLRKKLSSICKAYGVDGEGFIQAFIEMFDKCIYKYDRELYEELYQGDFRNEVQQNHEIMIAELKSIKGIVQNLSPQKQNETIPLITSTNNKQNGNEEDQDDLLEWELKYSKTTIVYNTEEKRKGRLLQLTEHWKEERKRAPQWYIIPENKRILLKLYTCDEELLYQTKSVTKEELFDFTYELVWRYESAFISYTTKLLENIRQLWDEIDIDSLDDQRKIQWFYIGQALLRDYREDLELEKWNEVYNQLWEKRDIIENGEEELMLKKIKLSFMQMKISETREQLITFKCNDKAIGVRLQIAGIKAECGSLEEAFQDLIHLEEYILTKLKTDSKYISSVQYKSVLASVYFMQSFVWQAIHPFVRNEQLKSIRRKLECFDKYFDFDQERKGYIKKLYENLKRERKSVPFEIDRDSKIIIHTFNKVSDVYDFYRVLDRMAIPLHIGWTRLLDDDESDFIKTLLKTYKYIGWFMLLRMGSTKTVEKVLGRRECIILNSDERNILRKAFDYTYNSVYNSISYIQNINKNCHGNAYGHVLLNGLEILKRLSSIANVIDQKKLIDLMCKLLDADIVKEYQVLNKWISHIMKVTEDRVKAMMLNELLTCSTKERTHMKGDNPLDPFDVFPIFFDADHFYQSAFIDPSIIDNMILRARENEEEKRYLIPRLGQMFEWKLLSNKQIEDFSVLLWKDISGENALPYEEYYFPHTILRWPAPDNINVAERVKRRLLDCENFKTLTDQALSSITFGDSVYQNQIQYLNKTIPDFWNINEIEILMKGFIDYWESLKKKFSEATHPEVYKEEFISRVKTLIHTISSFSRKKVQQMDNVVIEYIMKMIDDIKTYEIDTIELSVLVSSEENLPQVTKTIIDGLRAVDKERIISAVNASESILYNCYKMSNVKDIFKEMMILCLYRKEPGLRSYLNAIHQLLFLVNDIELTSEDLKRLYEILDNIEEQTSYINNIEKSEKEIKDIIRTRIACAGLSYQIYKYEKRKSIDHAPEVLNWKEICIGKKSSAEFVEVRKVWFE